MGRATAGKAKECQVPKDAFSSFCLTKMNTKAYNVPPMVDNFAEVTEMFAPGAEVEIELLNKGDISRPEAVPTGTATLLKNIRTNTDILLQGHGPTNDPLTGIGDTELGPPVVMEVRTKQGALVRFTLLKAASKEDKQTDGGGNASAASPNKPWWRLGL
mgnify:CR=1 FL=1